MQHFRGISLKTRLYGIVMAAFVPLVLPIFYVAEQQKSAASEALLQEVALLAQAVANEEDVQLLTAILNQVPIGRLSVANRRDGRPPKRRRFAKRHSRSWERLSPAIPP